MGCGQIRSQYALEIERGVESPSAQGPPAMGPIGASLTLDAGPSKVQKHVPEIRAVKGMRAGIQ